MTPNAHLRPIWYHSEPSDITYSPNQFLDWDFFADSYSEMALKKAIYKVNKTETVIISAYKSS